MSKNILEVQNLVLSIPVEDGILKAVRGISFSIVKGETLCLVGESGCGKSLTALSIIGLLSKTIKRQADLLLFDGIDLTNRTPREIANIRGRDMAMIFQDPMTSLNPTLSVGLQLTEGVMHQENLSREDANKRAIGLLDRVGIAQPAARMAQYPHEFSGGQRQRIMIAMALMGDPKLLIADEPTTALDVTIQAQILSLLGDLKDEFGLSLMLITHDLGVVASIADKVAVMYCGRIVEFGNCDKVLKTPLHPYTEGLLNAIPIPGVTPTGQPLSAIPGKVPELIGNIEGCSFRTRCSKVRPECSSSPIPNRTHGIEHHYECLIENKPRGSI